MKHCNITGGSLKNTIFRGGVSQKKQYVGRNCLKEGELGQCPGGSGWQKRGEVVFLRGGGVDTLMHIMLALSVAWGCC